MSVRTSPQHGFAAIAAIFLVVLLAALGGFMLTFSNTQQLTAAQDLQGSRAYWAARAGLAWAVAKIVATPGCPAGTPMPVDGFRVNVTCTPSSYVDGANTVLIYRLESRASLGTAGSRNYVERSVSAALEM